MYGGLACEYLEDDGDNGTRKLHAIDCIGMDLEPREFWNHPQSPRMPLYFTSIDKVKYKTYAEASGVAVKMNAIHLAQVPEGSPSVWVFGVEYDKESVSA